MIFLILYAVLMFAEFQVATHDRRTRGWLLGFAALNLLCAWALVRHDINLT